MSLTTQIRRTLVSIFALAAFGVVAATQGEGVDGVLAPSIGAVAACPAETAVEPAPTPATDVVRHDWRARLPATIARSRS